MSRPLKQPHRKTVALVLGSGSSRGWAHIGAIEALEEEGIPIDFISGCSVGSYVGASKILSFAWTAKKFSPTLTLCFLAQACWTAQKK